MSQKLLGRTEGFVNHFILSLVLSAFNASNMDDVETTRVTEFEYYLACIRRKGVHIFYSFRAMKVTLTLSFKVINFKHLLHI